MLALPSDLAAFIAYLAAPAFAAWVVSNFLESEAWFNALDSQGKNRVVTVVYVALGVLSYLLMTTIPSTLITQLQPIYLVISAAIAAAVSGEAYHAKRTPALKITATSQSTNPDGTVSNQTTIEGNVPQPPAADLPIGNLPSDLAKTPPLSTPLPPAATGAVIGGATADGGLNTTGEKLNG